MTHDVDNWARRVERKIPPLLTEVLQGLRGLLDSILSSPDRLREMVESLLSEADITINGSESHDPQIHDERFFERVLSQGSLGLGEAYMDDWWEVEELDEFFTRLFKAQLEQKVKSPAAAAAAIRAKLLNLQSPDRAFNIGEAHYDLGNDLYQAMLDPEMTYTCGYWENAETLEEAQKAKLELVCQKLGLKKGNRVLDIGCGWGSFLKYAAEKHGVEGFGITVSKEQLELARRACTGLPIEMQLMDYRELDESFDHIVSLGMFEHVGVKNYREYMRVIRNCLRDDGLFLLQTIGGNQSVDHTDPWIDKYIFPNAMLPSLAQITQAAEGLLVIEDIHNFGADYNKTLMAWFNNFNRQWSALQKKPQYDERFYRMWKYYLLACAGSFRSRKNQLWQIVFSKNGMFGGYKSVR